MKLFILSILFFGSNNYLLGAWKAEDFGFEQHNKLQVDASVSVSVQSGDQIVYSYSFYNEEKSLQPASVFALQVDSLVSNPPEKEKVQAAPNWKTIPGLITDNIRENATGMRVVSWVIGASNAMIAPGQSSGKFEIKVKSVPGIKRFYVQGYTENGLPGGEIDDTSEEGKAITELWNFFNNSYSDFTVGPDSIAEPSDPETLTTRLMDLNRQAAKLKWISDSVSFNQVEKHLKKAKEAITAKKEYVSRVWLEQLNSFLEEEKKKGSKDLTDNGYYLLKPNIDFILTKLPKKPKNGSERREAEKVRKNAK